MRKMLLLTTVLAALGGAALTARASQDAAPETRSATSPTAQDVSRKETDRLNAPRDARAHESRERSREDSRDAHEEKEDDDRD